MRRRTLITIGVFLIVLASIIKISGILHFRYPETKDIENAITSTVKIDGSYNKGTMLDLKKNYRIMEKDVDSFVYFAPLSSMDASEILVVKFKSPQIASSYVNSVNVRKTKRIEMYRSYRPLEAEILNQSFTQVRGNYLIFVASKNVSDLKLALDKVFR